MLTTSGRLGRRRDVAPAKERRHGRATNCNLWICRPDVSRLGDNLRHCAACQCDCRTRPRLLFVLASPIKNSSIVCPALRAAASQRGCFPRPDQVSEGSFGLRYFGNTRGYLRLVDCSFADEVSLCADRRTSFSRRSCARRFSSSRLSEVKRTDKTRLISS